MHCTNNIVMDLRNKMNAKLSNLCMQWEAIPADDKFMYLLAAVDGNFTFYFSVFLQKLFKLVKEDRNKTSENP